MRLALTPVVRVLRERALLTTGERRVGEGSRADGLFRVIVLGDDPHGVGGHDLGEDDEGLLEGEHGGLRVGCLDPVANQPRERARTRLGVFGIRDAQERRGDVCRGDGPPVAELQSVSQVDRPYLGIGRRRDLVRERQLDRVVGIEGRQRVIEGDRPCLVGVGDRAVGVEGVLDGTADDPHPERPAIGGLPRWTGTSCARRRSARGTGSNEKDGGCRHCQGTGPRAASVGSNGTHRGQLLSTGDGERRMFEFIHARSCSACTSPAP